MVNVRLLSEIQTCGFKMCMDKKDDKLSSIWNHFELKYSCEWICIYSLPWYLAKIPFQIVQYFVRMYHRWRFTNMFSFRWTRDSVLLKLASTDNKLALQKGLCSYTSKHQLIYRTLAAEINALFPNPLPTLVHLRPRQIARTVLGFLFQRVGNGHGEVGVWIPPQNMKENRPMGIKASFYRKWFTNTRFCRVYDKDHFHVCNDLEHVCDLIPSGSPILTWIPKKSEVTEAPEVVYIILLITMHARVLNWEPDL